MVNQQKQLLNTWDLLKGVNCAILPFLSLKMLIIEISDGDDLFEELCPVTGTLLELINHLLR